MSPLQSSSEVSFWFVSCVVELDEVEFEGPASGIEFVRPTSSSIVVRHTIDINYAIVTTFFMTVLVSQSKNLENTKILTRTC